MEGWEKGWIVMLQALVIIYGQGTIIVIYAIGALVTALIATRIWNPTLYTTCPTIPYAPYKPDEVQRGLVGIMAGLFWPFTWLCSIVGIAGFLIVFSVGMFGRVGKDR